MSRLFGPAWICVGRVWMLGNQLLLAAELLWEACPALSTMFSTYTFPNSVLTTATRRFIQHAETSST